jgi:RNA polymerase sigma-70 factor (ECF subfamily)
MPSAEIAASIGAERELSEDRLYESCAAQFGPALERLAVAYEADEDLRRDLLQEIHAALWRSLGGFDRRCSLRTWVYRVAHNTASSHVAKSMRRRRREWVSLEEVDSLRSGEDTEEFVGKQLVLERLMRLIQELRPGDKQLILLYLEGLDAAGIGEVTGLSPGSTATKIHRIKAVLARQFHQEGKINAAE